MRLKCCWRCSCSTNLKKPSAIVFAVCWLNVTRRSASPFLNCFFGLLACSVAALMASLRPSACLLSPSSSSVCSVAAPLAAVCSVAAPRPVLCTSISSSAVTSAASARLCAGNAKSTRCLTTMPSDANAQSLAARSAAVCTNSREELSTSSLGCCCLRRSMITCCNCLYV